MNQKTFNIIKDNSRYMYKHKGRNVYCLIHPSNINNHGGYYLNGFYLESLRRFFDKTEGFVYYETYGVVKFKKVKLLDLVC